MKINPTVLVDIKLCIEEPLNPRFISEDLLQNLAEKIENEPDFFGAVPCLAYELNGKYYIYSGAQRLKASKRLGLKKIPVRIASDLVKKGKVDFKLLKSRILKANEEASTLDYEILANVAPIEHIIEAKIPEVSSYIESIYAPTPETHEVISENVADDDGAIVGMVLEYGVDNYVEVVDIFEELRTEEESMSEFLLRKVREIWKK